MPFCASDICDDCRRKNKRMRLLPDGSNAADSATADSGLDGSGSPIAPTQFDADIQSQTQCHSQGPCSALLEADTQTGTHDASSPTVSGVGSAQLEACTQIHFPPEDPSPAASLLRQPATESGADSKFSDSFPNSGDSGEVLESPSDSQTSDVARSWSHPGIQKPVCHPSEVALLSPRTISMRRATAPKSGFTPFRMNRNVL